MPHSTPETSRASGCKTRLWSYILAILLLPAVVLMRQDNILFTPPGHIDAWVYVGFFRNLVNFKQDLFPRTYYGSRLSWILPGFTLHSIFTPITATVILNLTVFWVGALSLFATLRFMVSVRRAFLATLIFGVKPQVWYAIGTGYVDGAGIAYSLLAMSMLTMAAVRPERWWVPVLAGAAIAALVYDTLFWVALCPLLALHYAGMLYCSGHWSNSRVLRGLVLGCGSGFLLVTLALCAINYALDGSFWFYAPSIGAVPGVVKSSLWDQNPWTSHGLAPWLWLTATGAIVALVAFVFNLRRLTRDNLIALLVCAELLLAIAVLAFMQFRLSLTVLGLPYYSSSLLPFVFLVCGTVLWQSAEKITQPAWLLLCLAVTLVFGVVWSDYAHEFIPAWPRSLLTMALAGSVALAVGLVLSRRPIGTLAALAGLACFTAEARFVPLTQLGTNSPALRPESPNAYHRELERIMKSREKVESFRQNGPVRFWYDDQESPHEDYIALNSTYLFLFTRFGTQFPTLSCGTSIPSPGLIAVTSQREHAGELALEALTDCTRPLGLRASILSSEQTESPHRRYSLILLAVGPDPARAHCLHTTFDVAGKVSMQLVGYSSSALEQPLHWTALYPELGSEIHPAVHGLALRTGSKSHTDAAQYGPFVVPASGRYEFVLHVKEVSGKFAFGVVSEDGWLAADVAGHSGSANEMRCSLELKEGQTISLRVSNINDRNVPATFVITSLTAVEFDPVPPSEKAGRR